MTRFRKDGGKASSIDLKTDKDDVMLDLIIQSTNTDVRILCNALNIQFVPIRVFVKNMSI